jgi:DNA-directed RNA polymerase I, II, and III subunit RPABC2
MNSYSEGDDSNDISTSIVNITKTEIISNVQTYEKYYRGSKVTKPFLTKYEESKLVGVRAQMISAGSKPLVTVPPNVTDTKVIAELELKEKKIPLLIRRKLPNGEYEDWRLEDLIIL